MHMKLNDCPLRVVVSIQFSKIGKPYTMIFIEKAPKITYIQIDCELEAAFKMKEKSFNEWWEDAESKSVHEACEAGNINEQVLNHLIESIR